MEVTILSLAACADDEPAAEVADTGPQEPCVTTTTVVSAADDGMGFAAEDVVGATGAPAATTLTWTEGGTTTITLVASGVGEVRRVDREDNDAYTADTGRIACTDFLAFDADLTFSTADGALVGSGAATFSAFDFQSLSVRLELADAALSGSYEPPAERVAEGASWTLNLGASMNGGATTGAVSGYAPATGGAENELWNIGVW
jgi:hypothetical protein